MFEETDQWRMVEYEGFEIHVAARAQPLEPPSGHEPTDAPTPAPGTAGRRYTYVGYVCHPGANPELPGHAIPFHAEGDERFDSEQAARDEGVRIGHTIVDGTHPDLTVLPLVTGGV